MNISIPSQEKVIHHYGKKAQTIIHCEELGELIRAISKMHRIECGEITENGDHGYRTYCNLLEELADVLICIEQIKTMYSISDAEIQKAVNYKCRRQEERVNGIV